jgi:hypothetical protein
MNAIKIGTSKSLRHRLSELQVGFPGTLRVLCAVLGDWRDERWLHRKLRALRIRGEWFRAEPSLREFIASLPIGFDLRSERHVQHEREQAAALELVRHLLCPAFQVVKAKPRVLSDPHPFELSGAA